MDTVLALEAVLFWRGEPTSHKALAELILVSEEEIKDATEKLRERLTQRGVRLLEVHDTLALVTAPEMAELITRITKEELSHDIGKAGLETLSVILYRGPLGKPEIDYIRGVNSQYILRSLLIRGLIERLPNPKDSRTFIYRATPELLAELGVTDMEALPEWGRITHELNAFMERDPHASIKNYG